MFILVPLLFAISLAGLSYALLRAFHAGAEVYSGTYSADTARQFEDLFVFIPPKRIAEAGWAAGAAVFMLTFLLTGDLSSPSGMVVGLFFGAVTGTLALFAPRQWLKILKRRRRLRFNLQLVDTLMSMSNSLKAGFSITQAFEAAAREGANPMAQEFTLFLQQIRVGVTFEQALLNLEERVMCEDLTLMARAIETARKTGGNLTEILETISGTIRERLRIETRIRTLTAQGRLQGLIVGAMPAVIAAAMMIVDPGMMMPFLKSLAGLVVIGVVAILISCGALVIRSIVHIDV